MEQIQVILGEQSNANTNQTADTLSDTLTFVKGWWN